VARRTAGELTQQRALADAAGPVDEDDAGGGVVAEQPLEEGELAPAADEAPRVAVLAALSQRRGLHQASLPWAMAQP